MRRPRQPGGARAARALSAVVRDGPPAPAAPRAAKLTAAAPPAERGPAPSPKAAAAVALSVKEAELVRRAGAEDGAAAPRRVRVSRKAKGAGGRSI